MLFRSFDVFTEPARQLENLAHDGATPQAMIALAGLHAFHRRLVAPAEAAALPATLRAANDPVPILHAVQQPEPMASAPVKSAPIAAPAPDSAPVVSRLANKPRLRPVLQKFALRLHEQLSAMEAAQRANDLAQLAQLTHWLKGAAGTVGFDQFTAPATRLEQFVLAQSADDIAPAIAELKSLAARIAVPADEEAA